MGESKRRRGRGDMDVVIDAAKATIRAEVRERARDEGRHKPAMHKRESDWATIGDVRQEIDRAFALYQMHQQGKRARTRIPAFFARLLRRVAGNVR